MILLLLFTGLAAADDGTFEATLPLDIRTSDYYELAAWCERLDLDSRGTRKELEQRLRNYYDLDNGDTGDKTENDGGITIESASSLEYFTLDTIDETYIRLSGGVVLTMEGEEDGSVHEIRADSIVFNQDNHSLTATGSIEYVLTRGDTTEVFRGDSLTFDTDSWEGVFFKGISERERDTEGEAVTFFYSGDSIYRSEEDVVIMNDGLITSSEHIPPNYSIKASRIWVLAPGEWAIKSAVLYIGHVPIFYFPVFFKPGDPLFFHPSIGYKQKEGYFLQTTTYFLGSQDTEEEDTTISFLQTVGSEDIERSIDGLFLREGGSFSPLQKKLRKYADTTGSFFKLLVDVYSRLGYLIGVEGELKNLGALKEMSLFAAVGRSREIFESPLGYTPFQLNPEGRYESEWHSSYFLNVSLPFRYGLDLQFSLKTGAFSLSGTIPAFSDPDFKTDFTDRKEKTDWSELLGLETEEETTTSTATVQTSVWSLKSTFTPTVKALNPYIDTLSLTKLESSMYWKSRELVIEGEENSYFFYPDSFVLPTLSGSVKGVLFSGSPGAGKAVSSESDQTERSSERAVEIRSPWEDIETEEEDEGSDGVLRAPGIRGDITFPSTTSTVPFKHSLSYILQPDFSYDVTFDSSDWEGPDAIDYEPLYSLLYAQADLSGTYKASFYEDFLNFTTVQKLTVQRKDHIPGAELPEDDQSAYELQDNEATYLRLHDSVQLTTKPFQISDSLKNSLFSYSLKFLAFRREYNEESSVFEDIYLRWIEDDIQEHKVSFNFAVDPGTYKNTFGLSLQLPPLLRELDLSVVFDTGPLTSTFIWSVDEPEDDGPMEINPLVIRQKLTFLKASALEQDLTYDFTRPGFKDTFTRLSLSFWESKASLKQTFSYSLEDTAPLEAKTELNLWPLSFTFTMKDAYPYHYEMDTGWIRGPETEFLPYSTAVSLKADWKSEPLWKNRILIGTTLQSSFSMNLQQYTDNNFTFNLDFSFFTADFLDIKLKTRSENTAMHLYIPGFMESVGLQPVDILQDLMDSFNFSDEAKRRTSRFNLKSISLEAAHKLEDWDLLLSYTGKPELDTTGAIYKYVWETAFTVMLQWNPIPEIKAEIKRDESGTIYY